MKISVVIPSYNRADLIGETLDSVAGQTQAVDEIIVIDDGSEDDTKSVIENRNDPCIRYHRIDNGGVEVARSTGIKLARGEWIALIDSDDIWSANHIERLSKLSARYPDRDYLFSNFYEFGSSAKNAEKFASLSPEWWPELLDGNEDKNGDGDGESFVCFDRSIYTSVLNQNPVFTSCSIFRKSLHDHIGGIDVRFSRTPAADAQFVRKCAVAGKFACDLRATTGIRKHETNFSGNSATTDLGRLKLLDHERRNEALFAAFDAEIRKAMVKTADAIVLGAFSWRDFETVLKTSDYVPFASLGQAAKLRYALSVAAKPFKWLIPPPS